MDETPKPFLQTPEGPAQGSSEEGSHPEHGNSEGGALSAFPGGGRGPAASEKQWAVAIHLSALIGLVMPFFNILAPLVLWLFKRPESAWLDEIGKSVLNFQISFTIYALIAGLSIFVLVGFLLLPIVGIVYLAFLIVGAIRASEGVTYRFPLTFKFLS